ncbi:MAG: putative PEP-binding protein, partial [Xanthomonadales bacterium]|nr:putative PEP-binding protein [Xanthomonadales bacterium]
RVLVSSDNRQARIGDRVIHEGDVVTIDGAAGLVYLGRIPTVPAEFSEELHTLLGWADQVAQLAVMANTDTPEGATRAVEYGAMGIGLCRTERMFSGADRLPLVIDMILAEDREERQAALNLLLPIQREDFAALFRTMAPRPVTIRLLDPPIHEFLPGERDLEAQIDSLEHLRKSLAGLRQVAAAGDDPAGGLPDGDAVDAAIARKHRMLAKVRELTEVNPMLGHRGVRLGVTHPEIYAMQLRAILEAAAEVKAEGLEVEPEIMVPQVCSETELVAVKSMLAEVLAELGEGAVSPQFGTMIEVVRACVVADRLAEPAEFFSFGTNDLTQAAFSFSREDAENKFLPFYVEQGLLGINPFEAVDQDGVGALMAMAVEKGRATRPDLRVGICGEQAGDPESIRFCHRIGLTYVSCSPPRVPVARLAAAQAALGEAPPGSSV